MKNIRPISLPGLVPGILILCIAMGLFCICGSLVNSSPGIYSASLAGEPSAEGDTAILDESVGTVRSSHDMPIANFSAKKGSVTLFSVFFDGSLSEGSDLNYQWSFDDESILSSATPVKFYDGPVVGLVTLKVANSFGSDSITKKVMVGKNGEVTVERYPQEKTSKAPQKDPTPIIKAENETVKELGNKADYMQTFIQGGQLLEQGDFVGAIDSFNESINMNSSFTDAYYARGMAFLQTGYHNFYEYRGKEEFLQAVDDFSAVIEKEPENTGALIGRGAALVYLGDFYSFRSYIANDSVFKYYDAALYDFNKVLEIEPDNIDGLNGKAYSSLMLGSGNPMKKTNSALVEAAKKDAERSIRLNSTNPRAHFILGLFSDYEGLYTSGIQEFSRAIEQDPYEAWYYEWRGYEKFRKGDYDDAIKDYSTAISLQPRFADAYNMRGAALAYLMNVNDRSRELSDFNQAIEINPTIADFNRNYALALANWKFWDKSLIEHAVELLRRASELDSSDYRIYGDMSYLLTALNRNHEATEHLIKFQQSSLTNEEKMMANDLLAYNNIEPWYSNTWG
jgi:tetratricopeptide (TPR) repeat protein